ncbi:6-phosphogluconate dehydrogenase C-terminal domain-like protein [Cadophora sp. DSE1049]|nr:6-phosphogluconate dehydrogenase C-terminal domain-like protein [Cadophora sp. DSE1049]
MPPLATIGILSIGEMGMGIAKLLVAHNYRVVTNLEGRSADTQSRVKAASIENIPTDISLVTESDYIFSIVPPRDAVATAKRITDAFASLQTPKSSPLYYLDLNAISPNTARSIATLISTETPSIKFLDGGIIGGAPSRKDASDQPTTTSSTPPTSHTWNRPSIPVSGPDTLSKAPISGPTLEALLNIKHISSEIGPASGLKMCFATTTKGFTALCIQAFTTASRLGVLDELKTEMSERIPGLYKASGGVVNMAPKAYRWVEEMKEIGRTHGVDGGFDFEGRDGDRGIFDAVAEVYRVVADETVLGEEKTERRKRGRTVDDVALAMGDGLAAKRKKAA